ncbi:rhodanese-like domain-containing protein 11, chloroplastic [Chenopodium quinoa]|uniref:rhodanese-like domain-containing protein 11, chloroplastic n=1 Tax=Chenopodium quinoa TaxID=63459 RepID=UPI000B78C4CA|nr:rhodanese-like domain-containing protein 11, chloroplastic [Chenopodium quinoa]
MEALGVLPLCSPKISPSNFDKRCSTKFSRTVQTFKFSGPSSGQLIPVRKTMNWKVTRMQVVGEEYELRQMKDMAAARKRWGSLVREGKVKPLTPREAGYAIQLTSKTLLDVRPASERNKAWVKGSAWIPVFDVDDKFDVGTLSKKATNFMMGGWWSGVPTLSYNSQFLSKVEEKFPKDTDLIVACQKGLRSLAACELLCNAGYQNVFWIQGGLEAAEEEDLQREGSQPFKFAGIGGLSEFLGWTDQQRAAAAKEGWQYRLVFSARMVGLFLAADALYIAAQQVGRYLQEIRS